MNLWSVFFANLITTRKKERSKKGRKRCRGMVIEKNYSFHEPIFRMMPKGGHCRKRLAVSLTYDNAHPIAGSSRR